MMESKLEGHMLTGCLNPKEKALVVEMTRNMVKSKNIMSTLKDKREDNLTIAKQIYNARHRYKKTIGDSRT
jgi:hypothetical protein